MTNKYTDSGQEEMTRTSPAHARTRHSNKVLQIFGFVLVTCLALGSSVAFGVKWRLENLVEKNDVKGLVAEPKKPKDEQAGKSLNILIMGTDDRSGENSKLSGDTVEGMRSDTTMLVHISSDRSRIEVVSIPRDSMVTVPECKVTGGKVIPGSQRDMFNSAFARGWDYGGDFQSAAACTINTVQENTGLVIDHHVIVDFAGYMNVVDALGGIKIDIPEDISSKKANNLKLKAGKQTIDGETALQLVRARSGTGWGLEIGSDLKRIERQQAVLDATIATALSKNILTDLPTLTSFVSSGLASLKTDPELANNLLGLATSMTGIRGDSVEFLAVPVIDDPYHKGRVLWTAEAETMWAKLAKDKPLVDKPEDCPPADDTAGTNSTTTDDTTADKDATKPEDCLPATVTD
ncbi:LCP family protein [Timonella sp. A28]|uniref:LCP family protein n=1 Tax=Timonella sp. A28 TaxID=3442640 RepID=UPI003EBDAF14